MVDKDQLINESLSYVEQIARKIAKNLPEGIIELEDLISYGKIGLVEAAQRFDPQKGVKFTTYAYYRIKGAIYDGLRQMGWFSRTQYHNLRFEEGANQLLSSIQDSKLGLIKQGIEDEVNEIKDIISSLASIYIISLDSIEGVDIKDSTSLNPHELYEKKEVCNQLKEAIEKLPQQEKEVIKHYYYEGLTLEEIGKRLGLSKSWTCRLHAKAIKKLNQLIGNV